MLLDCTQLNPPYEVCCELLFCLVWTAAYISRTMVCVGQLHSQHPSLHCLGVINTAELILKSPVVGTFSQFPMRNVMTSIITFLLHSLFSPSKQPGGDTEEILREIIFISILWRCWGAGDLVENHYIYLYSDKIKDCMPIY